MANADAAFMTLMSLIVSGDDSAVGVFLSDHPQLVGAQARAAATRQNPQDYWFAAIDHYLYAGDTALHIAAAAHRPRMVTELLRLGANVGVRNRRGAYPLHYATDGGPGLSAWRPEAQQETVNTLMRAGADPNAADKSGVGPLHRAVRNRCAAAVAALLAGGADPRLPNKNGSTPLQLAEWTTGRGGSGSAEAKAQQREIVALLRRHGAT